MIPDGFSLISMQFRGPQLPFGAVVTLGCNPDDTYTTQTLADSVRDSLGGGDMSNLWGNDTTLYNVHVKDGPDATGPHADSALSVVGTMSGSNCLPGNVALLVSKATIFGGRAGRGRFYFPGLTDTAVGDDGVVDAGVLDTIQTALDDWYDDLRTTRLIEPVLLHADSTTPYIVESFQAQGRVASQRHRNRR